MKVGVLGLGSIGMRHAKNLIDLGHEVVAYDTDLMKMMQFQGYAISREEIFTSKLIKAVVCATPTKQHEADLIGAVDYGLPLLIEKPIAEQVTPELINAIELAGEDQPIMVGYNLRFHDVAIRLKSCLDKGIIGQVHWAQFYCGQLNARYGDSVLLNWSHEIDLALWLLGPATVDSAMLRRRGRIDCADLNLCHKSGAGSTIHLDYLTSPCQRGGKIAGSKGVVSFNLENPRFLTIAVPGKDFDMVYADDTWDKNYVTEMEAFLRRAEGRPAFGATAKDGVAALRICMEALR